MLLVVDQGNTNVVFALYEGTTQKVAWRAASDPRRSADDHAVWLTQLMRLDGFHRAAVTGAIVSSVVPAADFALRRLCERHFRQKPLFIGDPGVEVGIPVRVDRPDQVGADRLVNALSTHRAHGGPAIVIDFGTATTLDVIGEDGAYEGGVIAPGVNLSMEALYNATAMLPRISLRKPERVIGKATVPCMQSGVYWGYVAMIEGLVARIRAELDRPVKVVATGGLAALFQDATDAIDIDDPEMTLRGLAQIYRLNTEESS